VEEREKGKTGFDTVRPLRERMEDDAHSIKNVCINYHLFSILKMRQGEYEILLLRDNGIPFLERTIGNVTYFEAEPDQEFQVRVNVYKNRDGEFTNKYLLTEVSIDKVSCNYSYRFDGADNSKSLDCAPLFSCRSTYKKMELY
jgi:hypothetical protein